MFAKRTQHSLVLLLIDHRHENTWEKPSFFIWEIVSQNMCIMACPTPTTAWKGVKDDEESDLWM
jgi:hypothetical protein